MKTGSVLSALALVGLVVSAVACSDASVERVQENSATNSENAKPSDERPEVIREVERTSFVCLVDARVETPNAFLLVREVVDAKTGVTKAFDQLITHVSKQACDNFIKNGFTYDGVSREKNALRKEDLRDSFLCLKDASAESSRIVHLVRATRDASRGVVTSLLALNEFDKLEYCAAQVD